MSERFLERLARGRVLLDGALGTSLIARGGIAPGRTALASLEHPALVQRIHREFLDLGCEVVGTNTFAAHRFALERVGAGDRETRALAAAVGLARAAVASVGRGFVAGSLGPIGLYVAGEESLDAEELTRVYERLGRVLAQEGVDALSLETFADAREAALAIAGLRAASALPITACVTFERGERGWQTPAGEPLAQALATLERAGADALGLNCGVGSAGLLEAWPGLSGALSVPLIARPNAGLPRVVGQAQAYEQEPEEFAAHLARVLDLGASAVGGCCGADPRYLAALAATF